MKHILAQIRDCGAGVLTYLHKDTSTDTWCLSHEHTAKGQFSNLDYHHLSLLYFLYPHMPRDLNTNTPQKHLSWPQQWVYLLFNDMQENILIRFKSIYLDNMIDKTTPTAKLTLLLHFFTGVLGVDMT